MLICPAVRLQGSQTGGDVDTVEPRAGSRGMEA